MRRGHSLAWHRACLAALLALVLLVAAACGGENEGAGGAGADETEQETSAQDTGEQEAPEQVTLKVLTFLPTDNPNVGAVYPRWVELVEEKTNGVVTVEHAGGPEAVPPEEQLAAVRRGVADVNFNVSSFTAHEVPGAQFLILSPFTPAEERGNGFFDFIDRVHADFGVKYLGRFLSVNPFYIWTNERVASLEEVGRTRLRSAPAFHHVVQGVGAEPINLSPAEIFTALERGVINGFVWPLIGPRETGWTEVTKHVVNAPFYNQNAGIYINSETWERLGEEVQQQVTEATAQFEEEMVDTYLDVVGSERDQVEQAGVEFIELPDEDRERFHTMWYERSWEAFGGDAGEELTSEAKELLDYDEIREDPERILAIPCAGTATGESVMEGCG